MLLSIQYLRALAVIFVVLAHTVTQFGVIGVDIFFIISGFIMMHILYKRQMNAKEFFIARFLRIAPIYYLMSLITLAIGMAYEPTIKHILESFLFLKLHWTRPILTVGWTLEYEFIFYVSISFVLLFTRMHKEIFFYTSIVLLIGTILVDIIIYPQGAYGYFIEFWYGMLIYYLLQKDLYISKILIIIGILLGLLLGYFSMYTHDEGNRAFLRFLTYGIPAFLIVFFALIYEKNYKIKEIKVFLLLGNASFSIYLSHLISLNLYYRLLNINKHDNLIIDILGIVTSIVMGIIIYIFIEQKLNNYIHKNILKRERVV